MKEDVKLLKIGMDSIRKYMNFFYIYIYICICVEDFIYTNTHIDYIHI